MKRVGLVGGRGMIATTLLARMREERDDKRVELTILAGERAECLGTLKSMDILLVCKGGGYTEKFHPLLRNEGWGGYWIDASSALRMESKSCLVLDPVNLPVIEKALGEGVKTFVGANCTVSLMLMGLTGLFRENLVEWINSDTYQAASGAGAAGLEELLKQFDGVNWKPSESLLAKEEVVRGELLGGPLPKNVFQVPLAANVIPWIDRPMPSGQTREEWKGMVECHKILNNSHVKVEGTCVRVPTLRCHAQSFTIKLIKDVPLDEIADIIASAHQWVRLIPNDPSSTLEWLSTIKVSGSLDIPVGRLRKSLLGERYIKAFSMGDQLLWGGAEPLRRALNIILER